MKPKINPRFAVLLLFVIAACATRFITELGHNSVINFTPVGAMALFGGAYFSNRFKAILFTIIPLFISDLLVYNLYYGGKYGILFDGWYWVYISFAIMVFIGSWLIKQVNIKNVFGATIAISLTHFVITNFGVWVGTCADPSTGLPYTLNLQGFFNCYCYALPYLTKFFSGTVIFSGIMFGAFEWTKIKYPVLAVK